MGYVHHHRHGEDSEKNILVAFFLNLFFVIVEVVGGVITNSIAILSDAAHDFGDCLSLVTVLALQRKSKQGRNRRYSYGYRRFSLLGAIFLSGVLSVSSGFIIYESFNRLFNPESVDAVGMLWIAVAGIVINGAAALRVKKGHSLNEKAVYLHIMEDVLGWIAVLVAGIVLIFVDFPQIDALLSLAISLWVLYNVVKNLRSAFRIFLQAVPEGFNVDELKRRLSSLKGVESMHDVHVWSLDGERHVMTLHIVVEEDANCLDLKEKVVSIALEFDVCHTTVEFEKVGTHCCTNCDAGECCL